MHEQPGTPTSTRTGSRVMDLDINANPTLPSYPSLQRRSRQIRWILGRFGLISRKMRQFAIMLVLLNPRIHLMEPLWPYFVQWNYGVSGNIAQARSLISAIRSSGFKYGIYSSPGVSYPIFISRQKNKLTNKNQEWSTIFGSTSFVLDSSAPLWFATYNNVQVSISPRRVFNSKTFFSFFFCVVDYPTNNSLRRVSSPFLISVYNLSKLFQPDGPLLLATNTPTNLPQDYLTSMSLIIDFSNPFPLLFLRSSLIICTSRRFDPPFVGKFSTDCRQ